MKEWNYEKTPRGDANYKLTELINKLQALQDEYGGCGDIFVHEIGEANPTNLVDNDGDCLLSERGDPNKPPFLLLL